MTHRVTWLRAVAAFCVVGAAWSAAPAHAGMFDDNEARRAVLDLRSKSDNLANQLSAAQRTILDQSARLDQLNQQVATLRGENEDLTNRLTTLERQQKEYYEDLDTRLKKFEPQQKTIDGVEGTVQPGETDALNAAQQQFRNGNFKAAAASFRSFLQGGCGVVPQLHREVSAESVPADRAVLARQCAIRAARLPRFDGDVASDREQVPAAPARRRRPRGDRHEPARARPEGGREEDVRAGRVAVRGIERGADGAGQARVDQIIIAAGC